MGCGASADVEIPPAAPPVVLESAKFAKIFEKENVTAGAWLSDSKYICVCGSYNEEDHAVEVYDVNSQTLTPVTVLKGKAWPCVAASKDGKLYALALDKEVHVLQADNTELLSFTSSISDGIFGMSFSPDNAHLVMSTSNSSCACSIFSLESRSEVHSLKFGGSYGRPFLHWRNNESLLVVTESWVDVHDISKKTKICQLSTAHLSGHFDPRLCITKSGKIFAAVTDKGRVHLLSDIVKQLRGPFHNDGPDGFDQKDLEVKSTWQTHHCDGPNHLQVFSDDDTVLFEYEYGGHLYSNKLGEPGPPNSPLPLDLSKKMCLKRGEGNDDQQAKLDKVELNPSERLVACMEKKGLKLYTLGREVQAATPET